MGQETGRLPKQYRPLAGQPMLRRAVRALLAEPRLTRVVVAVAPHDVRAEPLLADLPTVQVLHCGGATRAQTVQATLARMGDDSRYDPGDWVLVHDAARPGLPADALARLIDACLAHDRPGLLALPVADTVKRAQANASKKDTLPAVQQTVVREGLWLAQTPQMARLGLLQSALDAFIQTGAMPTDEAAALECAGHAPLLVQGDARNAKVTWPHDFLLMEKWL